MWQYDSDTWTNKRLTCGIYWLVFKVPRGPVVGFHVAPSEWFIGSYVKVVAWTEFEPMTYGSDSGLAGLG
jgi:hypothetical protein